ncbi:MAG: protein phosphatase 2C domain-containing protein [Chloroflexota bacterium]|nr:protein phosphatase 2C domain-containing protein [Chloroflexota bacterium]
MDAARIELSGATDVGRRREQNEDAWTAFTAGPGGAWQVAIVADGMGGHSAGEVASALAVDVITRELSGIGGAETPADPSTVADATTSIDPSGALAAAIERANRAIWEEARRDWSRSGMGTTVVGAILVGARAYLANVGDSPTILVRDGESRQVTRDHGWVAEQVEAGLIDPQDAPYHPYRNVLTRSLGTDPSVAVEVYEPLDLLPGDQVVLCSDGLTAHVAVEEVGPVVADADPEAAARRLIDLANERGGQDNITVVVARVAGAPG